MNKVQKAVAFGKQALLTADPEERARMTNLLKAHYATMTGGEIGRFKSELALWKENHMAGDIATHITPTENYERSTTMDKKKMTPETKAKLKAAKKEKPKKEPIKYEWDKKTEDQGRRVFTPAGVGVIRGMDKSHKKYLVELEKDESQKVVSINATKFKAFDEDYRDKYKMDPNVVTASGAKSISNGDQVAKALNGLEPDNLKKVAVAAGISNRFKAWESRNAGMQRMNLGNVLRGMLRRDEDKADAAKAIKLASGLDRPEVKVMKKVTKKVAEKQAKAAKAKKVKKVSPPAAEGSPSIPAAAA